jgi:hypothetical protein
MKKYSVSFDKRTLFNYVVLAESEEHASEIATQRFSGGELADNILSSEADIYEIKEINN